MLAKKMKPLVESSSVIREMFEEGKRRSEIYGAENVFDFSLGNPNLPPPEKIKKSIIEVLEEENPVLVHGYMNNSGYEDVRNKVAASIQKKYRLKLSGENIIMTVGAAGGLNVIFKTLLDPGDEVVTFAPYFGEYKSYAANYDGNLVVVPANKETFQPDLKELERRITAKTKIVIVNSPNNPSGVVYTEETIVELSNILEKKEMELGTSIYMLSDEPYRELVYGEVNVPYLPCYYHNAIVGYSYSKSLSLPGERIGYLVIPDSVDDGKNILSGANVANRVLGFVNAPSLIQRAVAKCLDLETDVKFYEKNRNALYEGLITIGYECVKPEGAFYLFMKAPIEDDVKFCKMAKEFNILMVPGTAFECTGYVRLSYCVAHDTILRALPKFKELFERCR